MFPQAPLRLSTGLAPSTDTPTRPPPTSIPRHFTSHRNHTLQDNVQVL